MKVYDLEITKNPLLNRDDVAKSLIQILSPCEKALVLDGAGLFVGNTSAHFSPLASLQEGWSRLLWGIAPLKKGGYSWSGDAFHARGFIEGTDPNNPNFWGYPGDYNQRMVEMAAMSLSLILCKEFYWDKLNEKEQNNLITWMNCINTHKISPNNWLFFRVLVNLAFESLDRKEFNPIQMEKDLNTLENMYEADGWYRDAQPFDNYNPFAMQYYSLIYYSLKKDTDVERCQRIKERVKLFAKQHIHYLNEEGAFIPYGRSLTYRFAVVSFYSACAYAGLEVFPWGVIKGIILRNLRWWFKQPIFDRDGFLTIGYVNPTLIIGEQYNSPGSPYWSLKTYLILALEANHPFWQAKELPLPKLETTKLLKVPNQIIQRTKDDDVVMLNGGQYPLYHMMHIAEKYSKFAYSSHYGFSASSSYYDFEKCGCDSMLYFSEDNEYWRPRRESSILEKNENLIVSKWNPFKDVEVITYLIPIEDYHLRIHKIKNQREVFTKEGGFAIALYNSFEIEKTPNEIMKDEHSISIELPWDCSMIEDLTRCRKAESIRPTPNLNYYSSATIVPVLESRIKPNSSVTYATLVKAWRNSKNKTQEESPKISISETYVQINNMKLSLNY